MQSIQEIGNALKNRTLEGDRAFHSWYQFVLGYPPHLVRYYVLKFGITNAHIVLDPFCGTGTTNVECKKLNITNVGVEANSMAFLASKVKTDWDVSIRDTQEAFREVIASAVASFEREGCSENISLFVAPKTGRSIDATLQLSEDEIKILPKDFISPLPLKKVLILREAIRRVVDERIRNLFLLALATLTVNHASNVAFGPEIYATKLKRTVDVLDRFYQLVDKMICDLEAKRMDCGLTKIVRGDARRLQEFLPNEGGQIDFVITSPPYPNEKDYTRTTRLESIILGLLTNKKELRELKEQLLRSNSRNIFVADNDSDYIRDFASINRIADEIESKRLALKKTSGFEKMYQKIVRHYFGGMYKHFASLKPLLKPDARLAYVVGDQMSFFRTHIPTAKLLAEIVERLGYQVEEIELWRTRLATATKTQIDENVLIMRNR
jgi:DNA modification methylase